MPLHIAEVVDTPILPSRALQGIHPMGRRFGHHLEADPQVTFKHPTDRSSTTRR